MTLRFSRVPNEDIGANGYVFQHSVGIARHGNLYETARWDHTFIPEYTHDNFRDAVPFNE